MRPLVRWLPILAIAATTAAAAFAASPPLTRVTADALAASPSSNDRDARLADWAPRVARRRALGAAPSRHAARQGRARARAGRDGPHAGRAFGCAAGSILPPRARRRRRPQDRSRGARARTASARVRVERGRRAADAGDYAGCGGRCRVSLEAGLAYRTAERAGLRRDGWPARATTRPRAIAAVRFGLAPVRRRGGRAAESADVRAPGGVALHRRAVVADRDRRASATSAPWCSRDRTVEQRARLAARAVLDGKPRRWRSSRRSRRRAIPSCARSRPRRVASARRSCGATPMRAARPTSV